MWGIGFGFEKLGIWALRRPVSFAFLLIAISAFLGSHLPNVRFNGDVTAVLPEERQAYQEYFQQKADFSDSSRDITILVRSDRLLSASGLEDLRTLHLEVTLNDSVSSVVSIFSVPEPDPVTGEIAQFLPQVIDSDDQAEALITQMHGQYPQAKRLIAPDHNTALMVVTAKTSIINSEGDSYAEYREIRQAVDSVKPADFEVLYTGITPIGETVVDALVSDQLLLTTIGLVLGTILALYIFKSPLAAFICSLPPALTALWSIGLFGLLDIPITYLTTVLPTLALILAFADGIVLYFRWHSLNAQSPDLVANLEDAVRRVGPASALTSITTILAFFSFSFASGSALKEFSALGMAVVALAFVSVIIALPLAARGAIALGVARPGKARKPAFTGIGRFLFALVSKMPRAITVAAIFAVIGLAFIHTLVRPEFRVTDYLPKSSETRQAEDLTNEIIGGRSPVFVTVPKAVTGSSLVPENRERLATITEILRESFDATQIISIESLAERVETGQAIDRLAEQLESPDATARSALVSLDGSQMLITIYQPSNQQVARTLEQLGAVRTKFAAIPWGNEVVVTGFDVLMADEFTRLIQQLRTSLLIAIFLGVFVLGVATRSPLLAIAAITPNLLPIFAVEFVIWISGGAVNLSEVIALTISFGIAIDNAVHVINLFNRERMAGSDRYQAMEAAVQEVAPALAASTAIICMSCIVTQLSVLPVVPVLGRLMIATLFVAYFSNLVILPANMLTLRWIRKHAAGPAQSAQTQSGK